MVENEESANGYRLAGKADVRLVTPASEAATRRKGGTTGNRGGKRRRVRGRSSMPDLPAAGSLVCRTCQDRQGNDLLVHRH